jgi:hypothetical protein
LLWNPPPGVPEAGTLEALASIRWMKHPAPSIGRRLAQSAIEHRRHCSHATQGEG